MKHIVPPRPSPVHRAQAEADAIVAYWAARGHKIEAWIEQAEKTKIGNVLIVRTNLINGLPSGNPAPDIPEPKPVPNRVKGSKHPHAKLEEDAVRKIRRLHGVGCTYAELAKHFGVSRDVVSRIVNRLAWAHV